MCIGMSTLALREFHQWLHAQFGELNGAEIVLTYGDVAAEHAALTQAAGVIDLSFRGRLCLAGADRAAFLHGQVTNDVLALKPGGGCYAALVNAKARMQSDLNIYALENELLLDFEPGLAEAITQRLEKFIVAADVQVIDPSGHFGLLSVQGPRAAEVIQAVALVATLPDKPFTWVLGSDPQLGEFYIVNQPRLGTAGYDLYLPIASLGAVADKLTFAARAIGGGPAGWTAWEIARIEAGIPRFPADMDETNLPPEAGLDATAISYTKGCYIGQEVIARIRTYGQVAKALRGLRLQLAPDAPLPVKGDKLLKEGKDAGYVTSAVRSLKTGQAIALGYVRREANAPGNELSVITYNGAITAVVTVPQQLRADASKFSS